MHSSFNRWWVFGTTSLCAMAAAGLCSWHIARLLRAEQLLEQQLRALGSPTASSSPALPEPAPRDPDFTHHLPVDIDVQQMLSMIAAACQSAGIEVRAVQTNRRPPSPRALGLVTISLQLQGGYPAVKHVLSQFMESNDFVTVQSMAVRNVAGMAATAGTSTEALVTLALWSRPQATVR